MSRQAQYAGGDDLPYDRELIRSGGVSQGRGRGADPASPRRRPSRRTAPPRAPGPPRRRRSFFGFVRTVLLIGLLAVAVLGLVVGLRAAAFNATVSTAPFPSTSLFGPLNGSERINVLMVGYAGGEHPGAYLADSIQVLSIDPTTDTTTSIPIPRDLWIEGVASFSQNGKVNEVFSTGQRQNDVDGAGELLANVLSEVTGLRIDHWISIDFEGFREMVDAVGGVTVDNPTAFSWTTNETEHRAGGWTAGTFEAGELDLDGDEALMYSRARYTSVVSESTDFARSARQARVIGGLRSKLGDGGVFSIVPGLQMMDAMEGRVRTDLSAIDLFLLSGHLSADRRLELAEGTVLTATTNTIGQYILIPIDWTGPGGYGGLRGFLERELAQPVGSPADAP